MSRQALATAKGAAKAPAVEGVLQRKCDCGNHAAGGQCESCSRKRLQRKGLSVGAVDDPLELEADRAAAAVMASGTVEPLERSPLRLSRAAGQAAGGGDAAPAQVHEVLRAPGQPLDAATRAFMEPRFGHDFSQVRIHTDAAAQDSAGAVDAAAYTVASHVVFGRGQFQPGSAAGQRLLAHELSHVVQQGGGSAGAPVLRRQPKAGGAKSSVYIKEIVVDQNTPQSVTAAYSDGSSFKAICSTGKGHCCVDANSGGAAGGACSESRSKEIGNNCTPIGTFTVTKKIGSGPIPFWTQFHDGKAVALHNYDYGTERVDGTPLSHGCVRMHAADAEKIYNGAVKDVTKVTVKNLAKPDCSTKQLQVEWRKDYENAGTKPLDGSSINPVTRKKYSKEEIQSRNRDIRETRDEMKSALGVNDKTLDAEAAAVTGGADVASRIPRCVPSATTEEQKLPDAQKSGFLDSGAAGTAADFSKALKATINAAGAEKVVRKFGEKLWKDATAAASAGGKGSDDRQLYWTRLMLASALRQWTPFWAANTDVLRRLQASMLQLLEQTSRGMSGVAFGKDPDRKRILVSGFDPFGFQSGGDIRQSNLSGAAALALDGQPLSDGKTTAEVRSVVYPVRYADFDAGMVENVLRPLLSGPNPPHLVMSISQGDRKFELEEFAGRRRSTTGFADNLGREGGGTPTKPVEAPGLAKGPEFIRTNVPAATLKSMRGTLGRTSAITEETGVKDLPAGASKPRDLPGGPGSSPGQAVEGSGGGFLSNEVFYRNSLLRTNSGSSVPVIHLHTPTLAPGASDATRNTLIESIRKILRASLSGI